MKNNKIYFLILCIIIIIIIYISIMLISKSKIQINKVDNMLVYNSWVRYKDEFYSTQLVDFVGDLIPNDLIIFDSLTVKFCKFVVENNVDELMKNESNEFNCTEYNYFVDDNIFKIYIDENEIIYKYEFNDEGQLLLINGDDNFEYKVYYNKIDG